jgi:hypothetical protein
MNIEELNNKLIDLYKINIDKNNNQNYNNNLIKFNLQKYFDNNKKILNYINNDARLLLNIIEKCYQYDILYQNNLKNIFFEYINIIYSEYIRGIL